MAEEMSHAHAVEIRDEENSNMFRNAGRPGRARRRSAIIAILVSVVMAGLGSTACGTPSESAPAPAPTTTSSSPVPTPEAQQTTVPFSGLANPQGLAVNSGGDVYVVDYAGGYHGASSHLVKLSAGTNTQTVLTGDGVDHPGALAADTAGNV